MAVFQSLWAKELRETYRPQTAGATHSQKFVFDVPASGFAANDVLELAVLAPYATIVGAKLVPIGALGAATVDVGLMSGELGDPSTSRTVGNELFAGAALTAVIQPSKPDAYVIRATEKARSIGVKFSAAVAAGEGKRIMLILDFVQG